MTDPDRVILSEAKNLVSEWRGVVNHEEHEGHEEACPRYAHKGLGYSPFNRPYYVAWGLVPAGFVVRQCEIPRRYAPRNDRG